MMRYMQSYYIIYNIIIYITKKILETFLMSQKQFRKNQRCIYRTPILYEDAYKEDAILWT